MQVKDLKEIASACDGKIDESSLAVLRNLIGEKPDDAEVVLCDRKEYFATMLWHPSDIAYELAAKGIEPTDANVQAVIDKIHDSYKFALTDAAYAFEYSIYPAINDVFPKQEKIA